MLNDRRAGFGTLERPPDRARPSELSRYGSFFAVSIDEKITGDLVVFFFLSFVPSMQF